MLQDESLGLVFLHGLQASSAPLMLSTAIDRLAHPVLAVLQDAEQAGYFYNDLLQILGQDKVLFYPSSYRRAVKYAQNDAANGILRTEVLARLARTTAEGNTEADRFVIVSCPEALSQLVVSKKRLEDKAVRLAVGDEVEIDDLLEKMREWGMQEQDYVYEPGQFAQRGSIVDVYSYSSELPFRIDFFGNEIDTIRTFDIESQLSKEKRQTADIVPELASTPEKVPLSQFLPKGTLLMVRDFDYVCQTVGHIYDEGFTQQALTERLETAPEVERPEILKQMRRESQLVTQSVFEKEFGEMRRVEFGPRPSATPSATLKFDISPQPLFHKNFNLLTQTLEDYLLQGYRLFILADSAKQIQRLRDIFSGQETATDTDSYDSLHTGIDFEAVDRTLHEGFADRTQRICLFTDHQIFDRYHKYSLRSDAARAGKMALTMKELQELQPGDFVVHIDYGIGKFFGLVRVPNGDNFQEMIRLIYQKNDTVDVSIHSLYKISKYRSNNDGTPPRLSTLGTGAWERIKERTKNRIKDIARDLIKLYARRRAEKGFAFSPDTYMQHELEASFLYEDTPDQLTATNDVKADMESNRPMDRLVCGDVGFGKTEVAVRAAFKAACDSKQVAVLVPTTVLAFQHFQTFYERLRNLPVRVDYLSRARSAKQTRQVLEDLKAGRVDILIGTHKILGKGVEWKDLGLLIIDEEQKFGVSTKEKLRRIKTNVDTLTMSATPIPRTLQFSLMGARDMSIIRTPPPNRLPVYTELTTFSRELIADAINFEMSRNGQVYFVSSRISNLTEIEHMIREYVPDARVAVGHGQMKPDELEKIVMGFINYDYDVLLSTTIVENGIDIPNANTIIINDAQRFGLSDLHQMRGRVGRSNRKAFCYLLAPPKAVLPPPARQRLEALENFSEMGSGFNLAMQDLDIRGAGNLLGAEQSGFMEDLGYDTYQRILNQAVTELKNTEFGDLFEKEMKEGRKITGADFVEDCVVETDMEMCFPDRYVPGSSERMLLYRELDTITTERDLDAYRKRLEDRFGPVPREGLELMQVVSLRRLGRHLGCERIVLKRGYMQMYLVTQDNSPFYRSPLFDNMIEYATKFHRRCQFNPTPGKRGLTVNEVKTVGEAVFVLRQMENGQFSPRT